jgi:hypothetical protein
MPAWPAVLIGLRSGPNFRRHDLLAPCLLLSQGTLAASATEIYHAADALWLCVPILGRKPS